MTVGAASADSSTDEAAAFSRLIEILNDGMLALMISVGHKVGLFATIGSMPAAGSEEIAAASGLNERYVREWLAAMTTGGLVVHDPVRMTFQLRPAYAKALARGLGVGDPMSGMCQHVGWLAKVEDLVVECFREGGGVSFETFGQVVWGSDAATEPYDLDTVDPMTVDDVLALLPEVARRLESGIDVADVGCGGGWQLNLLARRFPASRFVGYDLLDSSLEPGRRVARSLGLTNVRFEQKDAATLDGSEKFDFIMTFDAIHDQARPDLALRGIAKSLRAGGTYIGVDVSGSSTLANNLRAPLAVFKYTWSVLYCMTSSLAYNGMGLGGMWGEELAQKMMREAGFTSVKTMHLPANLINCYHIATVA